MTVVPGVKISGLNFDAGPQSSPALLQLGASQPSTTPVDFGAARTAPTRMTRHSRRTSSSAFTGYGMVSYSLFNQGVAIWSTGVFSVPDTRGVQPNDLWNRRFVEM